MDGSVTDNATPAAPAIPEGYETLDAFLAEARERFNLGIDADKENRDAGMEDLKFLIGDQWDSKVRADRERKKLPCLTINTLPQYVGQVVGDIRINRPSIKVRPAEDGDKKVAEVRQGLIRTIEHQSRAQMVYALAGEDQVGGGIGHFRINLEYAGDDGFDQDIRIRHIPNPFAVVWDPQSVDPTGKDARWCFVVDEMDRETFKAAYPNAQDSELTVPLAAQGWVMGDTVRVTEYWLMKETERTIGVVLVPPANEPQILDITDREDLMQFVIPAPDGRPRMRKVRRKSACMYLTNGSELLDPHAYEYQISRLPIIKVTGRETRVGEKRYRYGLVRFAKDGIRLKNMSRSSAAAWIAQAPKQQWLVKGDEDAKRFRNAHKSGDTVMQYEGPDKPERIDPATAPNALLQEAQIYDQDIKDTTGLHDASLGMRSNETSGKAIIARERQGDVATSMYHDNLNASIEEGGLVVNELIPIVYDTARTIMTLGEDGASTPQRINDPTAPEPVDLKTGKYDVVVETGPSYSTKRVEAAESMTNFLQAVPQAAGLIGDLVAEAQDWPGAEAIAKRLKGALPPGVADDSDEEKTPEQEEAKARAQQERQQKQQMAMAGAELELAGKKADIEYKRAQAAKLMSEARGAGAPQGEAGPSEIDNALQFQALRKARADADKAEAEAERAKIAVQADLADLRAKPLEAAHKAADLDAKLHPVPEPVAEPA